MIFTHDHSRTSPPISIDLGRNEPGMTLQYRNVERDQIVWRIVRFNPQNYRQRDKTLDAQGRPDSVLELLQL